MTACDLEQAGYFCLLCESDRRAAHLARCHDHDCPACELIAGSSEDTYSLGRVAA